MLTQFFDEAVKALDGEELSKRIDENLENQDKEVNQTHEHSLIAHRACYNVEYFLLFYVSF